MDKCTATANTSRSASISQPPSASPALAHDVAVINKFNRVTNSASRKCQTSVGSGSGIEINSGINSDGNRGPARYITREAGYGQTGVGGVAGKGIGGCPGTTLAIEISRYGYLATENPS